MWARNRIACLASLGRWDDVAQLVQDDLKDPDDEGDEAPLVKLFGNWQDPYLKWFIKSNLRRPNRVLVSGRECENPLLRCISESLDDSHRRYVTCGIIM
jgi:hypothetical protein